MAYRHSRVPGAFSSPNESWQASSVTDQGRPHVPSSSAERGPHNPGLHNYGVNGGDSGAWVAPGRGVQGSNHHFPALMALSNVPPPGRHSAGPGEVSIRAVQSHNIPSLLPHSTGGFPTPPVTQHRISQQSTANVSPLALQPPSWFNPSNPVFPAIPHQQGSGVASIPVLFPPPPRSSDPRSLPSPLAFPGTPHHNFPPPFPMMPPPPFLRPSFMPPLMSTPRPTAPTDFSKGLPGFNPSPAPVGLVERMGLSAVSGHETQVAGQSPFPDQTDTSDKFISVWMKSVEKSYTKHQQQRRELTQNTMKIPQARRLLSRSVELLSSLRASYHYLASLPMHSATFTTTMEQVNKSKEELLSIKIKFESGDTVDHLLRKITKCKDKRAREKRCRSQRRASLSARRERAKATTEKWLQEKRQEQLKAKTELSVQKAAAGVLGDVKKKMSELQGYISLIQALKELRDVRREASRKKGDPPPIEADELFSETHQSLVDLLSQQAVVYEQEEHALRVLMAEEVKEKMTQEKEKEEALRRVPIEPHPPLSDPMIPFTHYYYQADSSVEALASIRRDWDLFISSEGTTFPDNLDCPPHDPSTARWAEYLKHPRTMQTS